jgi:hypothetical protein
MTLPGEKRKLSDTALTAVMISRTRQFLYHDRMEGSFDPARIFRKTAEKNRI